ncbi:MAG TPA: hypothetical protein VI792_00575, partial [Candidatus Eisenbacteria bacterium]
MSDGAGGGRSPGDRGVLWTRNGEAVRLADLPDARTDEFVERCVRVCSGGGRLAALTALPARGSGAGGVRA